MPDKISIISFALRKPSKPTKLRLWLSDVDFVIEFC